MRLVFVQNQVSAPISSVAAERGESVAEFHGAAGRITWALERSVVSRKESRVTATKSPFQHVPLVPSSDILQRSPLSITSGDNPSQCPSKFWVHKSFCPQHPFFFALGRYEASVP